MTSSDLCPPHYHIEPTALGPRQPTKGRVYHQGKGTIRSKVEALGIYDFNCVLFELC